MSEWESKCLFVANLPFTLTNLEISHQLEILLIQFGNIVSVTTSRDARNRPYAFVQFEGPFRFDALLSEAVVLEDRQLRFEIAKSTAGPGSLGIQPVNPIYTHIDHGIFYPAPQTYVPYFAYDPCTQQQHTFQVPVQNPPPILIPGSVDNSQQVGRDPTFASSEYPNSEFKLFVKHLNGALVTQRKLLRRFQIYGHITDIELFKNYPNGSVRLDAFAFISYLREDQMFDALKGEDGSEWFGKILKCSKALKKQKNEEFNDISDSFTETTVIEAAKNGSSDVAILDPQESGDS